MKDNIYVNGLKCTAGSKILEQFYPMRDASCVAVRRKVGAIVLGTTNMNEFASGITGVNPIYGSSRNPWNKEHISGGSSGGSCVSVSAGMVAFSIGTDTGGSIRVPASFCGVAGLKPTYGKISSEGVIALAPSLDHIGIITRNVFDTYTIFKIITNLNRDDRVKIYNYRGSTIRKTMSNRKKIVIGCPDNYFLNDLNPRILKCFERFIETITSLGYRVKNISLNAAEKIERAWTTIRLAEASEQHAKFQRKSSEYSEEVATMLKMGKKVPAVRYIQSCKFRTEMINICNKIFSTIQIMIAPTTPITAPSFAAIEDPKKSLEIRQLLLRNVIPFNLIGFPALNIPLGLDKNNVPIGVQLIGKPNCEDQILSFANDIQNKKNYKFIPRI